MDEQSGNSMLTSLLHEVGGRIQVTALCKAKIIDDSIELFSVVRGMKLLDLRFMLTRHDREFPTNLLGNFTKHGQLRSILMPSTRFMSKIKNFITCIGSRKNGGKGHEEKKTDG